MLRRTKHLLKNGLTTSILSELDTSRVHYVRIPEKHIVIDFDIPDETGKKCYEKNVEEGE